MRSSRHSRAPDRRRAARAALIGGALLATACGGSERPDTRTGTSSATAAKVSYGGPKLLGQVDDKSLGESSGVVASRTDPGRLWTHNDAGDGPNLHCLTREARRCGTWRVTNAEAHDWEAIATGPGPVPRASYLYIGDIGDNDASRAEVIVYRVPEPNAPVGGGRGSLATGPADALELRYEDGPRDAEALVVHPGTGDLYVVTKDKDDAGVYKAAVGATVLTRVADFSLGGDEVVTGADISPDGSRVAVVTKEQAHELRVPQVGSGFDAVWQQPRRRVAMAEREQGEAITYRLDGNALLTTSEGSPMPLHEVALQG